MHKLGCLSPILAGIEFWSGMSLIGWGAWVRLDPRPLSAFVVYEPLVDRLSDGFWAWSALMVGLWQVSARLSDRRICRLLSALAVCLLYQVIAAGNILSDQPGPMSMVLCGLGFANAAVFLRVAR